MNGRRRELPDSPHRSARLAALDRDWSEARGGIRGLTHLADMPGPTGAGG